jgi:hypothetical protein
VKTLSLLILSVVLLSAIPARAAELEVMPMIGIGNLTGSDSEQFSAGAGFGLAVGGRFSPNFSLAGQLGYQVLSPDTDLDVSFDMVRVQVVPALHFSDPRIDFSIGPTLGMFFMDASTSVFGQTHSASAHGLELGITSALLFAVGAKVSLGPYLSWARLWATETCQQSNSSEVCDSNPRNNDEGFWTLGFGVRF